MADIPSNGWLSPRGVMFVGAPNEHVAVAFRYYGHTDNPDRAMSEAGWWKLTNLGGNSKPMWVGECAATERQRRYIRSWCNRKFVDYPDFRKT